VNALRSFAAAALLFAAAAVLGFLILVALFKSGAFRGVDILFYRGVILVALSAAATFGLLALAGRLWRRTGITLRDAVAAGALSLGLNLSFLVIFPVTIDRSVTVFLLGRMAAEPQAQTVPELEAMFVGGYLGEYRQIQRRMDEQVRSGNVEAVGSRYSISGQGRAFLRTSRLVAWMFDTDPRFLGPEPDRRPQGAPPTR